MAVTFSRDGNVVVSGSRDKSIKLWDASTGELERTLTDHTADAYSGEAGQAIRRKLLRTLTGHTGRVESLAFSPDGKTLATGGGGGDTSVKLWDMTKE